MGGFKFSKSLRQCGSPCFILKQNPQPLFTTESDHSSGLAIMGIVLYFIHENFKKIGFSYVVLFEELIVCLVALSNLLCW